MPTYEHRCDSCLHEWEDSYSIKAEPPKVCPECKQETARRMISLGGKGVVELTGNELVSKVKEDTAKLKKEVYSSEKAYSNFIGEHHYENLQKKIDNQKRNR
jgi:putative FmdB family regulatory protein